MSTKTEIKTCLHCGKTLVGRQSKYCSRSCTVKYMHVAHEMGKCENPRCDNEFLKRAKNQRFCCVKCKETEHTINATVRKDAENRPYTNETGYIIRLWFSKGDSKAKIAQILGRSLESVEKAFV